MTKEQLQPYSDIMLARLNTGEHGDIRVNQKMLRLALSIPSREEEIKKLSHYIEELKEKYPFFEKTEWLCEDVNILRSPIHLWSYEVDALLDIITHESIYQTKGVFDDHRYIRFFQTDGYVALYGKEPTIEEYAKLNVKLYSRIDVLRRGYVPEVELFLNVEWSFE